MAVVVIWALTGPLFGFSDTWQLVINTGTNLDKIRENDIALAKSARDDVKVGRVQTGRRDQKG